MTRTDAPTAGADGPVLVVLVGDNPSDVHASEFSNTDVALIATMKNMSRNEHFGQGFGLSRQEESEMAGRALGAHLWEQIMTPFGGEGGYRTSVRSEAYDRMRQSGYDADHIKIDNNRDGSSYVEHRSGPYRARWYGGTYADIHHVSDPGTAIDTLNVGHKAHPDKGTDLQNSLDNWHKETSQYYR